ncbi:beta strand repeat-containing protein [Methanobacterium aggregans]|uniref:beta strand repeat-containing protein n=1 Tax=Methanobacterium aggregans TaxID=1615586 RepID=UPI001AEA3E6D|nr:Ig-like domain repeat protein [Methanobacterium aggregans]MBP2045282.1 hypothetical protein [Methanobacterium aggregans]
METKNKHSILKIPLMLLMCVVVLSFGVNAVSAAGTDNSTIYVSTQGNDTWDGLNATYNGTSGPKKTITNATGTVAANGTVHIAQGTYNESRIDINQNMTITGENQDNTIINGQQSGNNIFYIAPGIIVTITNLTLTNNTADYGGVAIWNSGSLTLINSTFTGNTANYRGGAIWNGGSLTVINSTFTGNTAKFGGAIWNGGSLTVINSTLTGNTASYDGGAIWNYGGSLTVINSTLTGNTAFVGGAISNSGTLTLINSTLTGNTAFSGGAISNSGTLTLINSTFTGNTATDGGAIGSDSGSLTVINSTFTGNTAFVGGAISNTGGSLTVINSTFTGNTADYGGAIYNTGGSLTVINSTFTGNTADFGGAIYNTGGSLTVINSTFTGNTATLGRGGAIWNYGDDASSRVFHFNRIVGNSPNNSQIYSLFGTLDATLNWWGSNSNPSIYVSSTGGGVVDVSSWLVLNITAANSTTTFNGNTTVTVNLQHDNNGAYHDPANGHVPDGVIVDFGNNIGTMNPLSTVLVNGTASSVFTANTLGNAYITATIDHQTVSTPITVNQAPTTTTLEPVSVYAGQNVTFTAHVTDYYGNPMNEGTVTFTVGSITLNPVSVSNGLVTINWTIPITWAVGNYSVVAEYSGSSNYLASSNGTNLTVTPNPTAVTVDSVSGYAGQNVTFTADLVDSNGNPVTDGQVGFTVNNTNIGTADVSNGTASITWAIPTTWTAGNYSVVAEYSGSNNYLASTNSTLLTLQPSSYLYLNTTTSKKNPTVGDTFLVTYKLSNKGPDNATNVTMSFQIPAGLEFVNVSVDNGTVTYNPTNRTITWTLNNVAVGDPYLYLRVRALGTGSYSILPMITSETFNRNTDPLTPFTVNVQEQNNSNSNRVNAASTTKTVPMQTTGMPIAELVLAILAVLGGVFTPRKK